ncbi:MAG TPA: hypothetical protein VNZ05_01810 [Solirubrobacteraceae bacterium]|nr:hypothetical protein [Solirubrobacteraceae bacterium]
MRRATITVFSLALLALLVLAPGAAAENDGRGFYGASDDKVVTNAGFILIIFFPVLVTILSLVQRRLDKRKEARKKARAQLGQAEWRGGW